MIIRATCNDNDFTCYIERFFSNFIKHIHEETNIEIKKYENRVLSEEESKKAGEICLEYLKNDEKLRNIFKAYDNNEKVSEEDKNWLKDRIRRNLYVFVSNTPACSEFFTCDYAEKARYIDENLKIEIIDTLKDEWENGEAVYWLQHSGVSITQ